MTTETRRASTPRSRGLLVWLPFFLLWTAMVMAVVWWLTEGRPGSGDFLISFDQLLVDSWATRARRWLESHVEIYAVYAWFLFAPYVLAFALWINQKNNLLLRLTLHGLAAALFVVAAQSFTRRLEAGRPRMVIVKREGILELDDLATNFPARMMRKFEWHHLDRIERQPRNAFLGAAHGPKMLVVRTVEDETGSNTVHLTNQADVTGLTNDLSGDLANHLAPIIRRHLEAPAPELSFPSRLTAALDGFAYLALAGLAQAIHFRRRLTQREHQAALLESKLTQSRLHALQTQLQPHFLFNTLNGIATLVRRDPRVAEEMLASLSDLLRVSLAQSGRQEITLREELDFLDRYLALQQMRFGDRLIVEQQVQAEALDCLVPSLVLQPLVENAIRHGIEPADTPGRVRIAAVRNRHDLILTVQDNGRGLDSGQVTGGGLGLVSVRERLEGLYPRQHYFTVQAAEGGGVVVQVRFPARSSGMEKEHPSHA